MSDKMYAIILRGNSEKAPKDCYASLFCIWKNLRKRRSRPSGNFSFLRPLFPTILLIHSACCLKNSNPHPDRFSSRRLRLWLINKNIIRDAKYSSTC